MKKLLLPSIIAMLAVAPAFAENIPTTDPGCTSTVLGAANIANSSAALEPDFRANTINTTWYSNGTQLTGNNIPATCTYDDTLTPPTPDNRPGYAFAGWKLRAQACTIPSTLAGTNGTTYGFKSSSFEEYGASIYNDSEYNLTEDNTWGVTWENSDKVIGEALCSAYSGDNHDMAWAGNSSDWTADETTLTAASGKYCWCRATNYIAAGAQQCSLVSSSWIFVGDLESVGSCTLYCVHNCAIGVQIVSAFRTAVFTDLVAQ